MPNCFQLTRKGEREPATLVSVDEAICAHLGCRVDPVRYAHEWYDSIGFALAMGDTFDKIRNSYIKNDYYRPEYKAVMVKIVDFLEANYTTSAWAEIGRR